MYPVNNTYVPSFSPQILGTIRSLYMELGALMQSPALGGGINMGPNSDTMTPSNRLFSGALAPTPSPYGHCRSRMLATPSPTAGYYDSGPTPTGSGVTPTVSGATPTATGSGDTPTPTAGDGTPTPTGTGATPTPTAGGGTPTATASGGGNSDYVNMMIKALKDCGAPDSLVDAYKKQYQLLGLMPSDGSSSPTPTAGSGAPTPTAGGGAPTAGGQFYQQPGGTPTPTGGGTPTTGGTPTSTAGGSPTPPPASGNYPTDNAQGHPLGKIVVTNPAKYDQLINDAIQKYGGGAKVDPNIIKGMIWQESKGDPLAVGSLDAQGSKGLLQVTSDNATSYGFGNQFDPVQSIDLGVKMYADALKHNNGDVTLALGEYNQGPGAKTSANAQTYAQKVQQWASTFAQSPGSLPANYHEGQLE